MKLSFSTLVAAVSAAAVIAGLSACEVVPRKKGYSNQQALPEQVLDRCVPATEIQPKLIEGKSPIYPVQRLMARQAGVSIVSLIVTREGRVKDIQDIESNHRAFFNHTAAAVADWRFEPARQNGEAVEVQCKFKMEYGLR